MTPDACPPMVSLRALVDDANHPWITNDGLVVSALMRCLLQLLKARLRSLSWFERGYPGVFAKALAGRWAFESLLVGKKSDWELWQQVQQMPGAILWKFVGRSSMQHMVVQNVLGLAGRSHAFHDVLVGARGDGQLRLVLMSGPL